MSSGPEASSIDFLLPEAQNALRQGDRERARELFEALLALQPGHPAALIGLANLAILANDPEEIIAVLERLPMAMRQQDKIRGALGMAYNNRGARLQQQGDLAGSQRAFQRAVAVDPQCVLAYVNSAKLYLAADQPGRAEAPLAQALRLQPGDPAALFQAARLCLARGDLPGVRQRLVAAEANAGGSPSWLADIAEMYLAIGEREQALARFERLMGLEGTEELGVRYARMLFNNNRASSSVAYLRRRTDLDADPELTREYARALRKAGDDEEAMAVYGAIARDNPQDVQAAFGSRICLPAVARNLEHLWLARGRYAAGLDWLEREWLPSYAPDRTPGGEDNLANLLWSNFYLAYQGENDRALQQQFGRLLEGLLRRQAPALLEPRRPKPRKRPRLALVSAFWRNCTVGHYFGAWIGALVNAGWDVHLVLTGQADDFTKQLRPRSGAFYHWPLPPRHLAKRLLALECDLILYPELGMDPVCLLLAAMRLAPVQCCAWGHPVTTGLGNIDYFFSCAEMEPPGAPDHYSETLVTLPGLGTAYVPDSEPPPATRADLGLPEKARLYLIPQSPFKLHPDFDRVMVEIVKGDPQGRLVLFAGSEEGLTAKLRQRIEMVFEAEGLDPGPSLLVLPHCPRQRYLQINRVCDLMLDTISWSGGNTSLDAISVGLPVVTWPGDFMRGRQSAAMLRRLGLEDCIAPSRDRLAPLALELAQDPGAKQAIVERMRLHRPALFEDARPLASLTRTLAEWLPASRARR